MIEYDYTLKRDEKDAICTYKPNDIPTKLHNLVYIEGPNSSGKSTLLHIIALACHGLKNRQIKPALQEKIKNLIYSDYQDLSFNIKITDNNGNLEFVSEKKDLKNKEIILRDAKNKIISTDHFQKKYNLIYDIPENPTERLRELINEIKDMHLYFQHKLGLLRSYILKTISDIQEARDPASIDSVKNEIKVFNEEKAELIKTVNILEERLKEVRLFTYIKFYAYYDEITSMSERNINGIKKEKNKKKRVIKKISGEAVDLQKHLTDEIRSIEASYYDVTPLLQDLFSKGKEKKRFSLWKELIVREEIADPEFKQTLKHEGSHFRNLLEKEYYDQQKADNLKEAQVFREIIGVLEKYSDLKIKIPLVEVSISNFIEILSNKLKEYDDLIAKNENYKSAIDNLNTILAKREHVVNTLRPKLSKLYVKEKDTQATVDDDTDEYQIEKLENQLTENKEKKEYYKTACFNIGVSEQDIKMLYPSAVMGRPSKDLRDYKETNLRDKIYDMEKALSKKRGEINAKETNLQYLSKELKRLERKEPHPYQMHLNFLKDILLRDIQIMEQKMNTFGSYTKQLINNKYVSSDDLEDRKKYFDHVASYLAKRVGIIRHIDNDYVPEKIDLVGKTIFTKYGKEIKIADLGTGQGQSAYLKGLLGADDNRKIIALFDEVAMMDSKSLTPVYEKLKELHNNGQLLVGIIVQKAETINVTPIG
ncbi:MAG: hypothetical protein KKA79_02840 [Nanoarchaeota archaeon]|nr:hypothetical protein [Nanoarchaeota archaeon]